jgi:UDP-glucose 4-epimerase
MKNALVYGAGGFVGSHMVKRLKKEAGYADRKPTQSLRTGMEKTYKWIEDQVKHGDNK